MLTRMHGAIAAFFLALACVHADTAQIIAQHWRADMDYLAQQAAQIHPKLFHAMTPQQWDTALEQAKRAPFETREEQIVAIMRLVATIQDAHNEIEFPCGQGNATNYPLRLVWFSQGIVIDAAPPENASIVGGTLQAIDDTPIGKVWSQLLPLISHDAGNVEGGLQAHPTIYLTCSGILHALGITHQSGSARYTVEVRGTTVHATLRPSVSWLDVVQPVTVVPANDWVQAPARPPLWLSRPRRMFWYAYLARERVLYVQLNNVLDGPDETLAHFASRLTNAIAKQKPQRLILDLRLNTGGDNTLLRPLVMSLIQAPVNRPGALFVLIGPETFSAAQNLCDRLQYDSNAVFIGQPTADNVNFYADIRPIVLPNTKIEVHISHLYWQDGDPRDRRAALYPDVAVDPSLDDFFAGRDRALSAALAYKPEMSLEERLRAASALGFDRAYREYVAFVGDPRHKYVHGLERRLNTLAYDLLSKKTPAKAVVVFRINTTAHPTSSNAWGSLGDGYAAAGLKDDAIGAYRRSIEIDPTNADAASSLHSITGAP